MDSSNMAAYMRRRRHTRIQIAKDYLGGKCVICGTTEELEFDHVDPATKLMTVTSAKCLDGPLENLMTEVQKCQLLCHKHHLEKTSLNGDDNAVEHGGGVSGKKNCPCALCKNVKAKYMRTYGHPKVNR